MSTFNPQVGDRCNWRVWSDVEPCTVIRRTPKSVTVRQDKAIMTKKPVMVPGGFAAVVIEQPEYEIEENPTGGTYTFTLRKNGMWKAQGTNSNSPGNILQAGWRYHYDYAFCLILWECGHPAKTAICGYNKRGSY